MTRRATVDSINLRYPGGGVNQHRMNIQRKLVAVLAADVVGYTSLMEAAEEATHARLMGLLSTLVTPNIARHGGRVVKNTGDGFLAVFDNANDAMECAVEIQKSIAEASTDPETPSLLFRMSINLTKVIVEPHDVFGDGGNLAARLQASAEPGGLVGSAAAAEQLRGEQKRTLTDLGELH